MKQEYIAEEKIHKNKMSHKTHIVVLFCIIFFREYQLKKDIKYQTYLNNLGLNGIYVKDISFLFILNLIVIPNRFQIPVAINILFLELFILQKNSR